MALTEGQYGRLLEPGLRKVFFDTYMEYPEQFSKVFNVESSKKAIETDLRMGGFGTWNQKGTMDSTEFADPTKDEIIQYQHSTWSKGFRVEKELIDDEMYSQIKKMSANLGRGARATVEIQAATVLNNGFGNTGYDGVSLFATNHPRLDGGPTVSNLLTKASISGSPTTTALSENALQAAMILSAQQVDEAGIKIQMNPKILVVPRNLEFTALQITKSVNLPGTNYNDINPLAGRLEVVVLDYLTNNNAWFIMDRTIAQLNFFWREKLNFKSETDFESDIYAYKGRMRFSVGYSDWRGIIGATGDGTY